MVGEVLKLCESKKASVFLLFFFILLLLLGSNICYCFSELIVEFEIMGESCLVMSFPFIFDWVSLFFSSVVILISGCVMLFSSFYMEYENFHSRFVGLVMMFVLSMNLLIFVPSMFGLMVGWDGLGIISFLLVIFYHNKSSLGAGMITVMTNRIGDVFFIISICSFMGVESWVFNDLADFSFSFLMVGLVVVGSMTKSAQIPFSAWLPAAMAAPTPVSALVHSSTLVTAGVFVLVRFSNCLTSSWGFFLTVISLLTLSMAGMSASFECDLKKIIALSTLSQLGMMMLIISVGNMSLCVFHLITHALFKALMFLCAGAIIHLSGGVQDVRCSGGLWYKLPVMNCWLIVSCLSLMGIPFMAGFYSKDLILEWCMMLDSSLVPTAVAMLGTFLTAFYSVRFLCLSILGLDYISFYSMSNSSESLVISSSILGVGAIFGGVFCQSLCQEVFFFVFVPSYLKMVVFFMVFGGVLISMGVFFKKQSYFLKLKLSASMGVFKDMVMKMWFLPMVSGSFLSLIFLKNSFKSLYLMDLGWVEGFGGGKGLSLGVKNFSLFNSLAQSSKIGVYISCSLAVVVYFMLCFNLLI